jgi:hypothetical protein
MEKVCESCKQSKKIENETSVVPELCRIEYQNVLSCMKVSNGSISECNKEWTSFRKCYQKEDIKPRIVKSN